jgi:hypothetical protein
LFVEAVLQGSRGGLLVADWLDIESRVDLIVAESTTAFDVAVITNSKEFLSLVRERCAAPSVGKGYWSTICLSWEVKPRGFQIEVFEDRLELYRFFDGHTVIENIAHRPGEAFPPTMFEKLPMLTMP